MNAHRAAARLLVFAAAACGGGTHLHNVLLPPHLNLLPYGAVGLVTFTAENAKGTLNQFATQRFEEYVLAAQTGIEVRDFPRVDSVQEVGVAALGDQRGVPVVFLGHLKISNVKPSGGLFGIASGHIEATVSADLSVELRATVSGGTLWRASAQATEQVSQLTLVGGVPEFSARDPNDAYGRLINRLVYDVTYDMRSTWVKQ